MSFSLRTRIGAVAFGLLIAGCPTSDPQENPSTDDGGLTDGGPGPLGDGATGDSAPPGPACSRLTVVCADGQKCEGAPDCASKVCREGTCQSVAPADGIKNGDETDVDCGGSKAPACPTGKGCVIGADCSSSVCVAGVCQAPSPTDGVKNGDETGKDCGGAAAPKCAAGEGCLSSIDCDKLKCDLVQKKCLPASHSDGIQNGDETGIDCGGPTPAVARCAPGQGCAATTDCANVLCSAGKTCDPPASNDGLKNGTETDVDCGGGAPTNAGACALGKSCLLVGDCLSTSCNYAKKCVEGPSCNVQYGGDTCGKGEVGQAGASHESCCARLPLPGNPAVSLGKYEITAGRVREFVKQTGGNVRGWVDANRAKTAQISNGVLDYLPEGDKLPIRTYAKCDRVPNTNNWACGNNTRDFGIYTHLGSTTIYPDRPCRNCGQGCWFNTGAGENGHTTYWFDKTTQETEWGSKDKAASQSELDVKSLNCVTQVLLAAFCAWDGGRLPTRTELGTTAGAWGPGSFPWGDTPSYTDTLPGAVGRVAYAFATTRFLVPMLDADGTYHPEAATMNSTNWNPFPSSPAVFQARYVWPLPVVSARNPQGSGTNDQAYAVAAPGRMRNDFRAVGAGPNDGFFDVAGNLIEVTGTVTSSDTGSAGDPTNPPGFHLDANGQPLPGVSWVGGSFEGHDANNKAGGYNLNVLTKYGKQGGRCAYDN